MMTIIKKTIASVVGSFALVGRSADFSLYPFVVIV